jgi:S-layer protein
MSSFTSVESEIEALYIGYFGRAGDPAGMQYWENQLTTGALTLAQVAASFSVQAESKALYPFLANPLVDDAAHDNAAAFINSVFTDLFNHGETAASDATGFAYWLGRVVGAAGNPQAIGQIIEDIISGAPAGSADDMALQNKVTVGDFFSNQLSLNNASYTAAASTLAHSIIAGTTSTSTTVTTQDAAVTAYLAVAPVATFTLTPNVDAGPNFTAAAAGAIFNALPIVTTLGLLNNTLNAGDVLTDTVGDGTLNDIIGTIIGAGANPPFATDVTMTGIKTLNITNSVVGSTGGFQGVVTGLTIVNDNNSVAPVLLGGVGEGLNTLLTNVNITGYGGGNGTAAFSAIIASAAASATATINLGITGAMGVTTHFGADIISFANASGQAGTAASPNLTAGTLAITANSTANLELTAGAFTGLLGTANVAGFTAITLAGAGNFALGTDFAGNFADLTSVNASTATGKVVITGSASVAGNSLSTSGAAPGPLPPTGANPNWLFGSAAGLLSGNTVFNAFTGTATGTNILDVSSENVAQFTAGKFTGNTTAAVNNQLVVADAVATTGTASTATFAADTGWQQLDVTGISGTINYANLPTTVNDIFFMTAPVASAPVAITNAPGTLLTVDTEATLTAAATLTVTSAAATAATASLSVVVGDATWAANLFAGTETTGTWAIKGESIVNISSVGHLAGAVDFNLIAGGITLTPALAEIVNFSGNTALHVGGLGTGGIFDVTVPPLMQITDTMSATLTLGDNGAGFSTNAISVMDTGTGALIMFGGDAFSSQTVGLAAAANGAFVLGVGNGDVLAGSPSGGNVIIGSTGLDTLSGGTAPDTFVTNGGPDAITLGASHAGGDVVGLYTAGGTNIPTPGTLGVLPAGVLDGITAGAATDNALAGYWGVGVGVPASATTQINQAATITETTQMYAPGTGTSTDMATVTGFVAGIGGAGVGTAATTTGDWATFSIQEWSTNGGTFHGLTQLDTGASLTGANVGAAILTNPVGPGGTVTAAAAGEDVLNFATTTANAAGVANALSTSGIILPFATVGGDDYHVLVAYNSTNGAGVNDVKIADLDFAAVTTEAAGVLLNHLNTNFVASDMVQLLGVGGTALSMSALTGANLHFIA